LGPLKIVTSIPPSSTSHSTRQSSGQAMEDLGAQKIVPHRTPSLGHFFD
jgi:hypothetical protein